MSATPLELVHRRTGRRVALFSGTEAVNVRAVLRAVLPSRADKQRRRRGRRYARRDFPNASVMAGERLVPWPQIMVWLRARHLMPSDASDPRDVRARLLALARLAMDVNRQWLERQIRSAQAVSARFATRYDTVRTSAQWQRLSRDSTVFGAHIQQLLEHTRSLQMPII